MRPRGLAAAFVQHPHIDDALLRSDLADAALSRLPAHARGQASVGARAQCDGGTAGARDRPVHDPAAAAPALTGQPPAQRAGLPCNAGPAAYQDARMREADADGAGKEGVQKRQADEPSVEARCETERASARDAAVDEAPNGLGGQLSSDSTPQAQLESLLDEQQRRGQDADTVAEATMRGGGACLSLVLRFALPPSAYATMLVRELLKASTAVQRHKAATLSMQQQDALASSAMEEPDGAVDGECDGAPSDA